VRFEVAALKRTDSGPVYFLDNGPLSNPPKLFVLPENMGLVHTK